MHEHIEPAFALVVGLVLWAVVIGLHIVDRKRNR